MKITYIDHPNACIDINQVTQYTCMSISHALDLYTATFISSPSASLILLATCAIG